jgi:hypothetical protein
LKVNRRIGQHAASIFRVEEEATQKVNVKEFSIWFHTGFLLGFFLDPEYGGHIFLRNVG